MFYYASPYLIDLRKFNINNITNDSDWIVYSSLNYNIYIGFASYKSFLESKLGYEIPLDGPITVKYVVKG